MIGPGSGCRKPAGAFGFDRVTPSMRGNERFQLPLRESIGRISAGALAPTPSILSQTVFRSVTIATGVRLPSSKICRFLGRPQFEIGAISSMDFNQALWIGRVLGLLIVGITIAVGAKVANDAVSDSGWVFLLHSEVPLGIGFLILVAAEALNRDKVLRMAVTIGRVLGLLIVGIAIAVGARGVNDVTAGGKLTQ